MITVGVESFRVALPELEKIWPEHHEELGLFLRRMPLEWEYSRPFALDMNGGMLTIIARWNGEIAGYCITEICVAARYSRTLRALSDLIYVRPQYRGHGLIYPIMRTTERELTRRGVKPWFAGYMMHNELGMPCLYDKLGFQPSETVVVKWLGNDGGA